MQMFAGDNEKERIFNENLSNMKEKFVRTMYNMTKQKEQVLFTGKLNKLVNLIRKADDDEKVDMLVYEIDQELLLKMKTVQKKL